MQKLAYILILLIPMAGGIAQQGLRTPRVTDEDNGKTGFYSNPDETEERRQREEEYQQLYNEQLSDSPLSQSYLLKMVFEPRVHDEVFETNLPGERQSGQWSVDLDPRLADLFGDAYVRFKVGLNYSWSDAFLVFTEANNYFPNPFENANQSGIYKWRIGAKYSWMNIHDSGWNLALGFKVDFPLADPPLELTDGYARHEPYVSVSRQLDKHPNWLVYFNMAYQFVEESPFEAKPIQPQSKDRIFLRPGFVYYPGGRFRYGMELEYRTNALDFRERERPTEVLLKPVPDGFRRENWILAKTVVHEVTLNPSITWYPTRKVREGLFIPGNYDIGLEMEIPLVDETGQDFSVSIRFRWYYDYRNFIAKDIPALFNQNGE